jgi:hypothetical protein
MTMTEFEPGYFRWSDHRWLALASMTGLSITPVANITTVKIMHKRFGNGLRWFKIEPDGEDVKLTECSYEEIVSDHDKA